MTTVESARELASKLSELNLAWANVSAMALIDLADQLEYLEERHTINDSQVKLFKDLGNNWKQDAIQSRDALDIERQLVVELRKQVQLLKSTLLNT